VTRSLAGTRRQARSHIRSLERFALGLNQSRSLFDAWANTPGLTYGLDTQLRNGAGRLMVEDIEVARYDATSITQPWQWGSLYYPYHVNHAG
jgi:hypothetical protein